MLTPVDGPSGLVTGYEVTATGYAERGKVVHKCSGPRRARIVLNDTDVHVSVETGFDVPPLPWPDRP